MKVNFIYRDQEIALANARLIAAAPDMLAALNAALPLLPFAGAFGDRKAAVIAAIAAARAAIAKAEGVS